MTAKEKVLKMVENLPSDASIEQALDQLIMLYKVEKGLSQVEQGQTVSHAIAKERFNRWLK